MKSFFSTSVCLSFWNMKTHVALKSTKCLWWLRKHCNMYLLYIADRRILSFLSWVAPPTRRVWQCSTSTSHRPACVWSSGAQPYTTQTRTWRRWCRVLRVSTLYLALRLDPHDLDNLAITVANASSYVILWPNVRIHFFGHTSTTRLTMWLHIICW